MVVVVAVVVLAAGIAGGIACRSRQARRLTDKDTIVLGDFANSTGDSVFDGTRKCYESVLLCPNIAAIVGNIQVFVFPEFAVCMACGVAQFAYPEAELRALAKLLVVDSTCRGIARNP